MTEHLHTLKTIFELSNFAPEDKREEAPPEFGWTRVALFSEAEYFQALRFIKRYKLRTKNRTIRRIYLWQESGMTHLGIYSHREKASRQ